MLGIEVWTGQREASERGLQVSRLGDLLQATAGPQLGMYIDPEPSRTIPEPLTDARDGSVGLGQLVVNSLIQ